MQVAPPAIPDVQKQEQDAIMAEQEALARAKYGNLATRGRAGSIGKPPATKRFDSADWAMSKETAGAPKQSLLQRTLQAEAASAAAERP